MAGMSDMEVAGMTTDLLDRLPELEQEAEVLERKAKALRQIIEGVRTLNGEAATYLVGRAAALRSNQYEPIEGPRGKEAVRRILTEQPGEWRVLMIKDEIRRRGWPSSPSGVEKAVMRMADDGEIVRLRQGVYKLVSTNGDDPEATPTQEVIPS